jgi:hypothetical protein
MAMDLMDVAPEEARPQASKGRICRDARRYARTNVKIMTLEDRSRPHRFEAERRSE